MQEDIINLLSKKKLPLTRTEIANHLGSTPIKVSGVLKTLLKHSEVVAIELDTKLSMKFYQCKRRMNLYYVE